MKKLLVLLFSILISLNSYGEWKKITENFYGDSYYIDFDSIKARNGYVYYWGLSDYITPNNGNMSSKIYYQVDCELDKYKFLSGTFYNESMGKGKSETSTPPDDWMYLSPDSAYEVVIDSVCDYVE